MTRKQKKNKRRSRGDVLSAKEIRTFAKRNGIKRKEDCQSLREFANEAIDSTLVVWIN